MDFHINEDLKLYNLILLQMELFILNILHIFKNINLLREFEVFLWKKRSFHLFIDYILWTVGNFYLELQSGLVYRDDLESNGSQLSGCGRGSHLIGLVWGEAFDWPVESTAVTAVSSQLVDASRGFSIVGIRGTIERLDRRVSNVPINEFPNKRVPAVHCKKNWLKITT